MRVHITTSVVSNDYSYAPGDKVTVSDAEGNRLINGGFAIRLVDVGLGFYTNALVVQGYQAMASASASIPSPSGGYFWDAYSHLHIVHPSGAHAVLDPLHLLPGWSP